MKIVLDKTYVKYSAYTIFTVTMLLILYAIISNLGTILKTAWMALGSVLAVLTPLIIALVIAYLLQPLVTWIDAFILKNKIRFAPQAFKNDGNQNLRRTVSVLVTYLLFMGIIVFFVACLYALVSGSLPSHIDLNSMVESITKYANNTNDIFSRMTASMENSGLSGEVKKQLLNLIQASKSFAGNAISGMFVSLQGFANNLLNIGLGFIIAFYFLNDPTYFKSLCRRGASVLFKRHQYEKIADYMADINGVVSSFIRGQLLDALIVGVLSSAALYVIGLDFAVFVGMTSGLFNIIPYFGPLIGSVLAVIVALLGGSLHKALLAVIVLVIVQQIDSNIISPKIVGDSVGLHPVFVMLAIIIGGSCMGLWGMLIAVPAAGIIRLILNRWFDSKEQKQELPVEDMQK